MHPLPLTEQLPMEVRTMLHRLQIMELSSTDTSTNSGGFTDEQLSNTDETRTIYRNSDGHPLVIQPDGNGNWVDFDGNTYSFADEQDAYDADGNSYYWHGEAADVYYMPVQ